MNIDFTEKELQVIELLEPGKTAEEIINAVLRAWFNVNVDTLSRATKTQDQVLDEIIAEKAVIK